MTPRFLALLVLLWTPVRGGWTGDDDDDDDDYVAPTPGPPPIVGASAFEGVSLVSVATLADLKLKISQQKKPAVVFVTTAGCPACKGYRNNVNKNANVKKMLNNDFIAVHIEFDGDDWQYEDEHGKEYETYVPRTYFLNKDGRFANLKGPTSGHDRYFYSSEGLESSMKQLVGGGTGPPPPAPAPKAEHFVGLQVSEAKRPVEARFQTSMQKKPAVIFVTKPGCPACGGYKHNVNSNAGLRKTMNRSFVVVHVEGGEEGMPWQYEDDDGKRESESYVPRTYFMNPEGKILDIKAPKAGKNPRYFYSAEDVAQALDVALHGDSAPGDQGAGCGAPTPPPPEIKGAQAFDGIEVSSAVNVGDVKYQAAIQNKPAVIFVTKPGCGACRGFKKNVNESPAVKELLKKFVAVHAESGAGDQWQFGQEDENYSPRTYFMQPDGTMLDFKGPTKGHDRYFYLAGDLERMLRRTLASAPAAKSSAPDDFDSDEL